MEDDKGSFSMAVCDEKVLVDMSLHPTPSEEVDPLKLDIKKEVEVDDVSDGKSKSYCNIVIKEEVDLQNICDLSWKQTEVVSVTSKSSQVNHKVMDMDTNASQFSAGNDCLTMKDIKTEKHKSDFDGSETYCNSTIMVMKEEDLGVDGPVCEQISTNSAAVIEEPDHKKLSGDLWCCTEKGFSSDVYICDHCDNVYKNKQHIQQHLTHPEYKCKILRDHKNACNDNYGILNIKSTGDKLRTEKLIQNKKSFSKERFLVGSSDENITSLKQSDLKNCGVVIRKKNKVSQIDKEVEKKHVCKNCKKAFTRSSYLKQHERIHTGVTPYVCKYCEKAFTTSNSLKMHERLHTGEKPYVCKYCEEAFTRSSYLEKHERTHTGVTPYVCKYCEKVFTTSNSLKIHERLHTGVKPYICKYCEEAFTRSSYLKKHERTHTGVTPYMCKYCEKAFTASDNLKTHELLHSGIKPHICKYCEKAFITSSSLKIHERLHTDVRPHICKYCKKAFTRSTSLKAHELVHTGVKPHICEYCKKAFTRSGDLKSHEVIHTGVSAHVCKYCYKAFTQSASLKIHERLHTGVKPYVCKYCEIAFTHSGNLKVHEFIHTGVKSHIC